jgi:hypothetical protein
MFFIAMEDRDYIDGLIGIYELNNVALLRDAYIESYMASAENYKTLRAELESPEKATLAYPDFVRKAVRRSVLDWKAFRPEKVMAMAAKEGIPEEDRKQVVDHVGQEFRGLHEGNTIRYRLRLQERLLPPTRWIQQRWLLRVIRHGSSLAPRARAISGPPTVLATSRLWRISSTVGLPGSIRSGGHGSSARQRRQTKARQEGRNARPWAPALYLRAHR